MSLNWACDIADMHKYFGIKDKTTKLSPEMLKEYLIFRFNFLQEELTEGANAVAEGDAEEIVDALIDLCVVAIGTLDAYGIDGQKAWDEVLRANMAKKVGVKDSRPNPFNLPDLIKPIGWKAPSHEGNHGLIPQAFGN